MPNEYLTNPLAIFDATGEAVKAITRRKVSFAPQTGSTASSNVGFIQNGLINTGFPNSLNNAPNYFANVPDPMSNRIIAACVNAKATAMASAPAILEEFEDGQWKQVDHECVGLLNAPNPYHSYFDCQYATTALEDTTGEAYWRIESENSGKPREIWVEPPGKFEIVGTSDKYISGYKFTQEAGGVVDLEDKDVIHFRRALNLHNMRRGSTPLFAGNAQVHGDNAASVYQAAVLDNAGVMSLLINLREQLQSQQGVVTNQITEMVEALKRKLRGPGAGAIIGLNLPVDVHKMGYSPDEMAIDKLIRYFTTTMCALLEVDPIIIHMASGPDSPTYANFKEAVEDFWTRTITPTNTRRDAVLRTQYLPLWNLDPEKYRIARDYSEIPALQEDKTAISSKVVGEYKVGIIDRYTAKNALKYDTSDEDKGVYAAPPKAADETGGEEAAAAITAKAWQVTGIRELPQGDEIKRFDPNQPRGDDGKWASGGASGVSSTASRKGAMRPATASDSEVIKVLGIAPAYTDILITDDPDADLRATAKNAKGKVQYYYTPEYSQKQAAAKFDRVKEIHNALPAMRKTWDAEIARGGTNAHEAMALRLISQTGFRVGGLEGGGDVEARGASSLKMTDVTVNGNRIDFNFIGKGGHTQEHSLVDAAIAGHIRARQAIGAETVFDTNDAKVRNYLKRTGGDFKVHDLRTRTASAMAAHYVGTIEKTGKSPTTAKELTAAKNAIADKVAKKLGDTRSVVLSSYIAPQVWQVWGG